MNKKISLSYSTMNALLNEPHTYLNKVMGLSTFQTQAMADGDAAHRIIQDHISGDKLHEVLSAKNLPTFSLVEREKWDEQMRVRFDIDEKYFFTGFIDGDEPERLEFLEIKTGKPWSPGEFARLIQWKLYSLGRPEHKRIWFINTPRDLSLWNDVTIKVYNSEISPHNKLEAHEFIKKAIYTIENIKEAVNEAEKVRKAKYAGRSRWCYYQGCEFCQSD